jgi:hypothetical protein
LILTRAARRFGWSHREMMGMRVSLIAGYLHHDRSVAAEEQLDAFRMATLPYLKPADQRRELDRLQRVADGEPPPTSAELSAKQKALWDAEWMKMRARLGGSSRAGDRVVIPG